MSLRACLGLALLATAGPQDPPREVVRAEQRIVYAQLPLRNFTGDPDAPEAVVGRVRAELERRGAGFVPAETLEELLARRRIRYTDSVAIDDARLIGVETGARYLIAGALLDFVPGLQPRACVALRVLDAQSGRRVASLAVSLRGEDFEGLLGLGRIEAIDPLLDELAGALLAEFDGRGAPRARPEHGARDAHASPPEGGSGFLLAGFDPATCERVALLPMEDRSGRSEATRTFSEFLGDAWFHSSGVQVVEQSELRRALIRAKVRSMQFVDAAHLAEIGRAAGVRYFALGSIDRWSDEVIVDGQRYPELGLSVRIIDIESGRTVAAAALHRRGDEYQTVLGLGAIHDPLELARRAASEIVAALGG